ncbi:MAG: DUF2178 domain-containing protein [Methanomicrobiales archaeon]|nr:DUF2178 domain-containing protein [Methanomicrobiales archaeon]
MDTRTYWICSLIVTIIVAGLVSWAVKIGNPYLAVITLLWAVGTLHLCRKRVHDVIEDERTVRINEKAAMKALEVFVIGGVIAGVVLYTLRNQESDFTQAGLTLGIAITGLLLLYAVFQTTYARVRENPDEK